MAPVIRSYDKFKEYHRSGKLTIDQIEDHLDERHNLQDGFSSFNGIIEEEISNNEVKDKPKSKKMVELQFLED
ncbi:hypothetical protein D3C71_1806490 [compost metagenome]